MRQLCVGFWMRGSPRKTKSWLEVWNFQPCLPFSWEGRRAENEVNDWSCLHKEASIKFQKYGVWRVSRLANTTTLGGWLTLTLQGQMLLCLGPTQTLPYVFHLAVYQSPLSYSLINRCDWVSVPNHSLTSNSSKGLRGLLPHRIQLHLLFFTYLLMTTPDSEYPSCFHYKTIYFCFSSLCCCLLWLLNVFLPPVVVFEDTSLPCNSFSKILQSSPSSPTVWAFQMPVQVSLPPQEEVDTAILSSHRGSSGHL